MLRQPSTHQRTLASWDWEKWRQEATMSMKWGFNANYRWLVERLAVIKQIRPAKYPTNGHISRFTMMSKA